MLPSNRSNIVDFNYVGRVGVWGWLQAPCRQPISRILRGYDASTHVQPSLNITLRSTDGFRASAMRRTTQGGRRSSEAISAIACTARPTGRTVRVIRLSFTGLRLTSTQFAFLIISELCLTGETSINHLKSALRRVFPSSQGF